MCEGPTDEQRKQLAIYAMQPNLRIVGRPSKGMPSRWHPNTVTNAEGFSFSEAGAWELIGQLLEQGYPIKAIELDNPPGVIGYTMKHQLGDDQRLIYIKIHFGNGKIVGRSFHYDC